MTIKAAEGEKLQWRHISERLEIPPAAHRLCPAGRGESTEL